MPTRQNTAPPAKSGKPGAADFVWELDAASPAASLPWRDHGKLARWNRASGQ